MKIWRQDKGVALLIVMWSLAVLMVVVLAFSFMARDEIRATIAFREGTEEKFLAEGGIERAAAEIMYRKVNIGAVPGSDKATEIWAVDGTPITFKVDDATCLVRIVDESGKIDINKTPDIVFKGLLKVLGVKDEDAETITDSVQDWRDADDLRRLNGAESDYYMSLPVAYKAKNADFESVEELLLVKGITQELFYGTRDRPGLVDFVTVYSESGKINISSAPREVLLALPGMSAEIAASIIDIRKDNDARSVQAALGQVAGAAAPYIITGEGSTYSVEAAGRLRPGKTGYGVKAVISVYGNRFVYRYYKSPWDITKWKDLEK